MYERLILAVKKTQEELTLHHSYNYDHIENKVQEGINEFLDRLLENLKDAEREGTSGTTENEDGP